MRINARAWSSRAPRSRDRRRRARAVSLVHVSSRALARWFVAPRRAVRRRVASSASSRVVGVESSRVVGVDVKFKSRRDARRRRDDERRSFTTRAHYRDGSRDARSLPVL
jgi:hypothetical protein